MEREAENETCLACRFCNVVWVDPEEAAYDGETVIECRRYPPTFLPEGGMAHVAVAGDGWCGEFALAGVQP